MGKKSLEQMIAQEMGRDAFKLFTTDEEFKKTKSFEELCVILKKRSNGKVETTHPTVQKMVLGWIASNRCKVADFEQQLKSANENKGHKGKISFRETLETHFKTSIWEYFKNKLKACDSMTSAIAIIKRESQNKVETSEITFAKTIESGLEAEEFPKDSFWIKWLPKRIKHKTAEEKEAEEKASHNYISVMARMQCQKCGSTGKRAISIFDKSCTVGLRGMCCPHCGKWATLSATFNVFEKNIKIASTTDKDECISENFVDDDMNIIPNPFYQNVSKEELARIKKQKVIQ